MDKNCNDYFTSGELSSLYKIPKQTLLYYDKIGLLKPAFISSNGYRHYAISQYLTLEIILNLRKLDIPIARIKEYITNKSPDTFIKLLAEKDEECLSTIAFMEKLHQNILRVKENTEQLHNVILNQIFLTYESSKPLCLTPIGKNIKDKALIKMIARHVYNVFSEGQFKQKTVGWMVDGNEFFNDRPNKAAAFYSVYDNDSKLSVDNTYIRPAGLYLKLSFQGSYYQKIHKIMTILQNFMHVNGLEPIGNIFVAPVQNHWVTDNVEYYINKIILRVKNIKKAAI